MRDNCRICGRPEVPPATWQAWPCGNCAAIAERHDEYFHVPKLFTPCASQHSGGRRRRESTGASAEQPPRFGSGRGDGTCWSGADGSRPTRWGCTAGRISKGGGTRTRLPNKTPSRYRTKRLRSRRPHLTSPHDDGSGSPRGVPAPNLPAADRKRAPADGLRQLRTAEPGTAVPRAATGRSGFPKPTALRYLSDPR